MKKMMLASLAMVSLVLTTSCENESFEETDVARSNNEKIIQEKNSIPGREERNAFTCIPRFYTSTVDVTNEENGSVIEEDWYLEILRKISTQPDIVYSNGEVTSDPTNAYGVMIITNGTTHDLEFKESSYLDETPEIGGTYWSNYDWGCPMPDNYVIPPGKSIAIVGKSRNNRTVYKAASFKIKDTSLTFYPTMFVDNPKDGVFPSSIRFKGGKTFVLSRFLRIPRIQRDDVESFQFQEDDRFDNITGKSFDGLGRGEIIDRYVRDGQRGHDLKVITTANFLRGTHNVRTLRYRIIGS